MLSQIIFTLAAFAVLLTASPQMAAGQELPVVSGVVSGAAAVNQPDANTLDITGVLDKSILLYSQMNLAEGKTWNVTHEVPGSSSLHRNIGASPATIFGNLNSNGNVFLISTRGLTFGPNSHVNTYGLIASGLDMDDDVFRRGDYVYPNAYGEWTRRTGYGFSGGQGTVSNRGTIRATNGHAILFGGSVANLGTIEASGHIALVAGEAVGINLDNRGNLMAVVPLANLQTTSGYASAVRNSGNLKANHVTLMAGQTAGLFDNLVNAGGRVEAQDIYVQGNGTILLTGTHSATRGIAVDGNRVDVRDAQITAKAAETNGLIRLLSKGDMTITRSYMRASGVNRSYRSVVSLEVEAQGRLAITASNLRADISGATQNPDMMNRLNVVVKSATDGTRNASLIFDDSRLASVVVGNADAVYDVKAVNGTNPTSGAAVVPTTSRAEFRNNSAISIQHTGGGSSKLLVSADNPDGASSLIFNGQIRHRMPGDTVTALQADGDIVLGEQSGIEGVSDQTGSQAFLTAGGNIQGPGLIKANTVSFKAGGSIGSESAPIKTDAGTVDADSAQGDIVINDEQSVRLGNPSLKGLDGRTVAAPVIAHDGNVKITSRGDLVVNTVVSENGGINLQSHYSSILAGQPVGGYAVHLLAAGNSYLAAPRGTIGPGLVTGDENAAAAEIRGQIVPGQGEFNSPALNNEAFPIGPVYYQGIAGPLQVIGPFTPPNPVLRRPLDVIIYVKPGAHSATPEWLGQPLSALTLRVGSSVPN